MESIKKNSDIINPYYSDNDKLSILIAYYNSRNLAATAREANMPVPTLTSWLKKIEETHEGDVQRYICELQKKVSLLHTMRIAEIIRGKIEAKLAGDKSIKESLPQLSTSYGIMIDKAKALGEDTAQKSNQPVAIQINLGVPRAKKTGRSVVDITPVPADIE